MSDNPLEPLVDAAVEGMRRRMDIVDRAVPKNVPPVGQKQLTAEELYMRDVAIPGFRQGAIGQASPEDQAKYYRLLVRGKKSFEEKHGVFPRV